MMSKQSLEQNSEQSLSLDGTDWKDNERIADWQCGVCGARFAGTAKSSGLAHIRQEHKAGTLYPRLNAIGAGMLHNLQDATGAKLRGSEPDVLSRMGFKAEPIGLSAGRSGGRPSLTPEEVTERVSYARRAVELRRLDHRKTWAEIADEIGWPFGSGKDGLALLRDTRYRLSRLEDAGLS